MKRSFKTSGAIAATAAAALLLSSCGEAPEEESEGTASEEVDYKACLVSDEGGWDDRSFNQSAFEGLEMAIDELGIDSADAQSTAESEYGPNVDTMVQQNCDVVFGVGFLLEEGLREAAEANPETNFALIDSYFNFEEGEELENAKPLVFNTGEAAYLAGYVAAAMSETGVVGTWGGIQIPSVTVFMDGYADGVERYNEDNDGDVELVGWDKEGQTGSFSGDFSDQTQGREVTEQLLSQDADIIMPVAGNAGVGAGPALEAADAQMIWVDSDGYESTDYGDIVLTSVMKEIGAAVYATIEEGTQDGFTSESYVGTLENEGVGLAPFHDFEDEVPSEVAEAIEQLRQEIIDGETVIESENAPS
ncbi:BMP family lipoprotein [Nesterenkonia sandarakina]|uniref:Nucleoside-binding protein n=1 Tax=Nesterenkonia sandarakina TaxID=272918 RepID=A0A2T0YRF1_9MICC|nr:BMP family ABC transporter substrate-binding protein [Nesterenkonia sandarakina]PRZ17789.1 nucleoside-binding protein [Nesterenkonia sandarakina]